MGKSSKKILVISLLVLISNGITPMFVQPNTVIGQDSSAFQQEIIIPYDLENTDELPKSLPVDASINFRHQCWAKSDVEHSIRVFYKNDCDTIELESQIYQLERVDEQFISSCHIVFILPEKVKKGHQFFLQYSNQPVTKANYEDHVSLKKSHYYYEPIPGQVIDLDYYSIVQDGIIPYAVSFKGSIFGYGVSQVIARLKPNATFLDTQQIDQFASFSMMLSSDYDEAYDEFIGTGFSTNPKTTILVDGNLFVKVKIDCISPGRRIKTSNIYSYYYCPTEPKRIQVNCSHEILKTSEVVTDYTFDGVYAYLLSFHSKSEAIEKINMGYILPTLQLYGKDDRVHSYDIPENPHSDSVEMILDTNDDVDLGSEAWFCIHHPIQLKTHALIFAKNNSITQSDQDGIAVKAFVEETINLPGLEVDTGSVYASRNHYDAGGTQQYILEKGFSANFDVSFVTFQKGTWHEVENESKIYQKFIKSKKTSSSEEKQESNREKTYTISGSVSKVNSVPFGSALSAYTGKNFSFVTAELYRDDRLISSTVVSRIPFFSIPIDFQLSTVKDLLNFIRNFIDWRNVSLLQRFRFTDVAEGDYTIRIYKENPVGPKSRIYIGYGLISISENSTIHIRCRKTVQSSFTLLDQKGNSLNDGLIQILSNNQIIFTVKSCDDGQVNTKIPYYPKQDYTLCIYYKNIPIFEDKLSFSVLNYVIPLKKSIKIDLHNILVKVYDSWELPPSVDVKPELIYSDYKTAPIKIAASEKHIGVYEFHQIPAEKYKLISSYKGFDYNQILSVKNEMEISLQLPLTYKTKIKLYDQLGLPLTQATLILSRESIHKSFQSKNQSFTINIPPGNYQLKIITDGTTIAEKPITIFSDNTQRIITMKESILPLIGYIITFLTISFSFFIGFIRQHYFQGLLLIYSGFTILSVLSPWWFFSGENGGVSVKTTLHLLPTQMISFIHGNGILSGEFSTLPSESIIAIEFLLIILFLSFALLFILQFINCTHEKIRSVLYIGTIGLHLIFLIGFLYLISQLTTLGVGSIIGSGSTEYTVFNSMDVVQLQSSWGFSYGFYISLLTLALLIIYPFLNKKSEAAENYILKKIN